MVVQSSNYALHFDSSSGLLSRVVNRRSGASTHLSVTWGWYNSSVGGCTLYPEDVPVELRLPACSEQKSGAYIFRWEGGDWTGVGEEEGGEL